jgi:hypothetical protein
LRVSLDALRRAGPLSDPVRVVAVWTLAVAGILAVPLGLGQVVLLVQSWPDQPLAGLISRAALLAAMLALPLSMWFVLWPGRTATVLYLRTFRSDPESTAVRNQLRAAWWWRLPLMTATALRCAGSNRFELEAGDANWLPRLLASCANAVFVVADVRDLSPYVPTRSASAARRLARNDACS